jgi:hypothetical protein
MTCFSFHNKRRPQLLTQKRALQYFKLFLNFSYELQIFICSLRFSLREEHRMGPSMPVCSMFQLSLRTRQHPFLPQGAKTNPGTCSPRIHSLIQPRGSNLDFCPARLFTPEPFSRALPQFGVSSAGLAPPTSALGYAFGWLESPGLLPSWRHSF